AHADDAIDHQKGITVRQRLEDRRDVGGVERVYGLVHTRVPYFSSPPASVSADGSVCSPLARRSMSIVSRNHCLIGLAGKPPHFAPGGTSPCTMLVAAICAPSPIVT